MVVEKVGVNVMLSLHESRTTLRPVLAVDDHTHPKNPMRALEGKRSSEVREHKTRKHSNVQ